MGKIKEIKEGMKDIPKDVHKNIQKAGRGVKEGVTKAGKGVQKGLQKAGQEVKEGIQEAGGEVQKAGKQAEKNIQKGVQLVWYKRKWIVAGLAVLLLVIIFTGANVYLIVNLLLGNDIIIKASANADLITLAHGEQKDITITASTITNLFCTAACSSTFFDISNNKTIEKDSFNLQTGAAVNKKYSITSQNAGTGQDLYSFSMECRGIKTAACHTTEIPTQRTILITANYGLSDSEKELKNNSEMMIHAIIENLSMMKSTIASLRSLHLNDSITNGLIENETERVDALITQTYSLQTTLHDEAYTKLADQTSTLLFNVDQEMKTLQNVRDAVLNEIQRKNSYADELTKQETLRQEVTADIEYDSLCAITGNCILHPTIPERAQETTFNLTNACNTIDSIRIQYALTNASNNNSKMENYSAEFRNNIGTIIANIKQNITNTYNDAVPVNSINTIILQNLLQKSALQSVPAYSDSNTEPALLLELARQPPAQCNVTIPDKTTLPTIGDSIVDSERINFTLQEPVPQCCIYGECLACCTTDECRNDPKTYPVVFLHGHAFTNVISAEYSLDAFNLLQDKMENDGYINAGAISLYTEKEEQNMWAKSWRPFSIKASYYFDVFKTQKDYVVVQTNSENVDTYAIRLRDIIDVITSKTGRPKITLIAHSMGGLVARRYIQIFGSDKIEKLIMIGVPNKGITGSTLGYCPLIGSKLECQDMSVDSLLLNKLNRDPLPDIPIYNIVGTGCQMNDGIGDGVILLKNSELDGVNNTIITGTCNGLDVLHTSMLTMINKYPLVYKTIQDALK